MATTLLTKYRRASLQEATAIQAARRAEKQAKCPSEYASAAQLASQRSNSSESSASSRPTCQECAGDRARVQAARTPVSGRRCDSSEIFPASSIGRRCRDEAPVGPSRSSPVLDLFREEAEYSDYLDACVTGAHAEMDSVVFYQLEIQLGDTRWTVFRRFSEFHKLRQRLVKHLSRRQRCHSSPAHPGGCPICANILQTIEATAFPRRMRRSRWVLSMIRGRRARGATSRSAMLIADRKSRLQDFISVCLATVRGLRQHTRLLWDSSACEVSVALRMIEELLGLSFTRYMRFLNERGVISDPSVHPTPCEPEKNPKARVELQRAPLRTAAMRDPTSVAARRRVTVAC
ncbi:hypothetical protein ATCC90586_001555 [Pythium insidiosum]|nr:hypothetical protein ATCC90586_001555 [Pythium insidiosum]